RLLERDLRLAALSEITRDLGEADEISIGVAYRIDNDMRPEVGAVLAHAPTLGFELALLLGDFENTAGEVSRPVLVRVEPGKMLANNLAGRIAFEALGPGVP